MGDLKRSPCVFDGLVSELTERYGARLGPFLARRMARDIRAVAGRGRDTVEFSLVEGKEKKPFVAGQWGSLRSGRVTHYESGRTFSWEVAADPD